MNTSTVVGTNKENAHMIFKNQEHEKFYKKLFHSYDAVFFWEAVQIRYGYLRFE